MALFKKIPNSVIIALLSFIVLYFIWDAISPSGTWRYRMTVVVETPEGIKTGSAVREVRAVSAPFDWHSNVHVSVKGQAIAVDLGGRGVLFALLNGYPDGVDYAYRVVFSSFPTKFPSLTAEGIRYYRSLTSGKVVLQSENYPMLVTFKYLNVPSSVLPVIEMEGFQKKHDPHSYYRVKADHTEELFSKGVKIKEISLEMTSDSVTSTLYKILPWLLDDFRTGYFGTIEQGRPGNPEPVHITDSLFTWYTGNFR